MFYRVRKQLRIQLTWKSVYYDFKLGTTNYYKVCLATASNYIPHLFISFKLMRV